MPKASRRPRCALGVLVGRDQQVTAAGGYLVQLMPGAPDSLVDQLEKSFTSMPSVTSLLSQGKTMEQIMDQALEGLGFHVLEKHPVAYECHCSRQKVEQALISMGRKRNCGSCLGQRRGSPTSPASSPMQNMCFPQRI